MVEKDSKNNFAITFKVDLNLKEALVNLSKKRSTSVSAAVRQILTKELVKGLDADQNQHIESNKLIRLGLWFKPRLFEVENEC